MGVAENIVRVFTASGWAQHPAQQLTMKMLKPDVWVGLGGEILLARRPAINPARRCSINRRRQKKTRSDHH
jgi:hypothetical protein